MLHEQETTFTTAVEWALGEGREHWATAAAKGLMRLRAELQAAYPSLRPVWSDAAARIIIAETK